MALTLAASLFRLEAESDGALEVVTDVTQLRRCLDVCVQAAGAGTVYPLPYDPARSTPITFSLVALSRSHYLEPLEREVKVGVNLGSKLEPHPP